MQPQRGVAESEGGGKQISHLSPVLYNPILLQGLRAQGMALKKLDVTNLVVLLVHQGKVKRQLFAVAVMVTDQVRI